MAGITHFFINPFLTATKGSASRAFALGGYTYSALQQPGQPPEIAALYAAYAPVWAEFETLYFQRRALKGSRIGNVSSLSEALRQLSDNIKEWAFAIEHVHRRGTPGYVALLPKGRTSFRDGGQDSRIMAVDVLELALRNEPLLADLHTEVAAFQALLTQCQSIAGGSKSRSKGSNTALEHARVALCAALYRVFCGLLSFYASTPQNAAAFFDTASLHQHRHRKKEAEATS